METLTAQQAMLVCYINPSNRLNLSPCSCIKYFASYFVLDSSATTKKHRRCEITQTHQSVKDPTEPFTGFSRQNSRRLL